MWPAGMLALVVIGCASSAPVASTATPPPAPPPPPSAIETEAARREKLTAAHHELEDEQISAFAAGCDKPPHSEQRCAPSCYVAEAIDARAKKKTGSAAEIVHHICAQADAPDTGPFVIADELGGEIRALRGRVPSAAKKGTWQAAVETEASAALKPELARGDVVRVTGAWKPITHPVTAERWRCVTISHFARSLRHALDGCGAQGQIACEATGSAVAHGLNVIHYRLAEAKRLHGAGDDTGCQQATLEAIAVSRGLPRFRQYATLNTREWKTFARYRTRFDGLLEEDLLFANAAALGNEAETVHAACGGASRPKTTAAQEQSFHTCW